MNAKKWAVAVIIVLVLAVLLRLSLLLPGVNMRVIAFKVRGGSCVMRVGKAAVIDNRYVYLSTYSAGSGGKLNAMLACADADGAGLYDGSLAAVCGAARGTSGCNNNRPELEAFFKQIDTTKLNFGLDSSHAVKEYSF